MLTSFPPSPMQQTRFLVCFRMRRATSAFCVGEHLQATTVDNFVAISINSTLKRSRHNYGGHGHQRELNSGLIWRTNHLQRLSVDDKTTIGFRLQKLQLTFRLIGSHDYSKRHLVNCSLFVVVTYVLRLGECTGFERRVSWKWQCK